MSEHPYSYSHANQDVRNITVETSKYPQDYAHLYHEFVEPRETVGFRVMTIAYSSSGNMCECRRPPVTDRQMVAQPRVISVTLFELSYKISWKL